MPASNGCGNRAMSSRCSCPCHPGCTARPTATSRKSRAPDGLGRQPGSAALDYAAITRGPLVYATGLIDGFKQEETIRLPAEPAAALEEIAAPPAAKPPRCG